MRAATASVLIVLACLACVAICSSDSPATKRTLVILDSQAIKRSHSIFFNGLRERGFDLTFATAGDASLRLTKYGEFLYDSLILFAPSSEDFGGQIDKQAIIEFIDSGRNAIIAASSEVSDSLRALASDCGIEFDEKKTSVIDHLHYDINDDGTHTLLVADSFVANPMIVGKQTIPPVLFRGVGMTVEDEYYLVTKVLTAAPSAYSHFTDAAIKNYPQAAGAESILVAALQARNNARVIFTGSLELFSDSLFTAPAEKFTTSETRINHPKSGNEKFVTELTKWVFGERGVLRISNVKHFRTGEPQAPALYTVRDPIEFHADIHQWDGSAWVPFTAKDVQLDFTMINPYVKVFLNTTGNGHYSAVFVVPDVYGVFQFKITYNRRGYTSLTVAEQAPVRPLRHNEFERFIEQAFPYYTGAFSMMACFYIFGLVFLYHRSS